MRHILLCSALTLLGTSACDSPAAPVKEPPILRVTSPARGLLQDGTAAVTVTGTVTANEDSGSPITKVTINDVAATLSADGTFTASVPVMAGATLIHTVAVDEAGQKVTDTRAVHAGELRPVGGAVEDAVMAQLAPDVFAKISEKAGPMIEGLDINGMIRPMQPMLQADPGSPGGSTWGKLYVDNVALSNVDVQVTPTDQGLQFRVQVDGLDIASHTEHEILYVDGRVGVRVRVDSVVVAGTLRLSAHGAAGFRTTLSDERVELHGLDIQVDGFLGELLDVFKFDSLAGKIISKVAPLAMEPMMNEALGGLAGPKELAILDRKMTIEVAPTAIDVDAAGAFVSLTTKMLLEGGEAAKGYVFTNNAVPTFDGSPGFQIALADDLANQMMAQVTQIGMLEVTMPKDGGSFDASKLSMTLPPLVSADPKDGTLKLVLGDVAMTFLDHGVTVGKAAINASASFKVVPANNGYNIAIELGEPVIEVDMIEEVENQTRMTDEDLAKMTKLGLEIELTHLSKLMSNIPLPSVKGISLRNLSVGSDSGYVMVKGAIE